MVDSGTLALRPAVELSYLSDVEQDILAEMIADDSVVPTMEQAEKLREYSERAGLTKSLIEDIMSEQKIAPVKVTLKTKYLHQYFSLDYTQQQMEEVIFSLLEKWKAEQEGVEPHDDG